ncbi:Flp family type IVb pilin [Arthrobacter crystallopoietes]|uniref:Flp family type IVb pilin n=1 Tax=Crystallibacter crystallopoietes TaxID=37928 RepID=UPI0011110780|nr:Flp family type IVb pilin [Arthrobacter crystallopoietes]
MLSIIATFQTLGYNLKNRFQQEEAGATAVEYALLVGLIAVVMIAGVAAFGGDLSSFFDGLKAKITTVPTA